MRLLVKKSFQNSCHKVKLTFESEDAGKTWFPGFDRCDLDGKNGIGGPLAEQDEEERKIFKTDHLTTRELLDLLELLGKFSESNISLNQ